MSQSGSILGFGSIAFENADPDTLTVLGARFANRLGFSGVDGALLFERLVQSGSLKDALGISDELVEVLYARAFHLIRVGHIKRARDLFFILCALDDAKGDHWLGYGICLSALDDAELALAALDRAVQLSPRSAAPQFHRLRIFMYTERWHDAGKALRRLVKNARRQGDVDLLNAAVPFRVALQMRGCDPGP
jgi:tetratricopeptide (TPR) repeat protein